MILTCVFMRLSVVERRGRRAPSRYVAIHLCVYLSIYVYHSMYTYISVQLFIYNKHSRVHEVETCGNGADVVHRADLYVWIYIHRPAYRYVSIPNPLYLAIEHNIYNDNSRVHEVERSGDGADVVHRAAGEDDLH